jgi:hypothetical protein
LIITRLIVHKARASAILRALAIGPVGGPVHRDADGAPSTKRRARSDTAASSQMDQAEMLFLYRAATVAVLCFLSTILGFGTRTLASASYLEQAEGMIRSIVALEASLLALVLGLLVWTCHGLFTTQLNQWQALGRAALIFDLALSEYGLDAENGRQVLSEMLGRMRGRFWKDDSVRRRYVDFEELSAEIAPVSALFASLRPTNDEQSRRLAKAEDAFSTIFDTQLTMLRSLVNPVPNLLFNSVVGWACLLFFGYGLLSPVNLLTSVMAALGAVSIGSATFLVLELSDPYVGLFRMNPSEFDRLVDKVTALQTPNDRERRENRTAPC